MEDYRKNEEDQLKVAKDIITKAYSDREEILIDAKVVGKVIYRKRERIFAEGNTWDEKLHYLEKIKEERLIEPYKLQINTRKGEPYLSIPQMLYITVTADIENNEIEYIVDCDAASFIKVFHSMTNKVLDSIVETAPKTVQVTPEIIKSSLCLKLSDSCVDNWVKNALQNLNEKDLKEKASLEELKQKEWLEALKEEERRERLEEFIKENGYLPRL